MFPLSVCFVMSFGCLFSSTEVELILRNGPAFLY